LFVFIREKKEHSQDVLICSRSSTKRKNSIIKDISVKFYIAIRNGLIKFLETIHKHFNLVLYISTSKEIGSLIIEYLESKVNL